MSKRRSAEANRADYHEWSVSERLKPHPNVLRMIGLCPSFKHPDCENVGTTAIISPWQENGSLQSFYNNRTCLQYTIPNFSCTSTIYLVTLTTPNILRTSFIWIRSKLLPRPMVNPSTSNITFKKLIVCSIIDYRCASGWRYIKHCSWHDTRNTIPSRTTGAFDVVYRIENLLRTQFLCFSNNRKVHRP